MFKLVSLNLNGIRSASSKGLEAWLEQTRPDCICVQEVKAQAPDVAGRFEQLAGLRGHFHFAEKKGYSGVGVYTPHSEELVAVLPDLSILELRYQLAADVAKPEELVLDATEIATDHNLDGGGDANPLAEATQELAT